MILGKEHELSMIQLMYHVKLTRNEHQRVDALVLLRRGNKIIIGSRDLEGFGRKRRGEG